ncbi:hypothetical protein [Clostridium haemolyticum]|uniref:hypothetical protein n=1 Tax=Clostridium haemolyticum TaxID=84025 RepID=UPI001FA87863|nr:hypothetical protein [Clostridium haemolyticum]
MDINNTVKESVSNIRSDITKGVNEVAKAYNDYKNNNFNEINNTNGISSILV